MTIEQRATLTVVDQPAEHLTRTKYPTLTAALADAERALLELDDAVRACDTLFLTRDEAEFLTRRARKLVTAAYRVAIERAS